MIYFEETIFDSQEEDKICFACNKDIEKSSKFKNYKISKCRGKRSGSGGYQPKI